MIYELIIFCNKFNFKGRENLAKLKVLIVMNII